MPNIRYIDIIPSADTARANTTFNVLGGVANGTKAPIPMTVTLWGRADSEWKSLAEQTFILQPEEHKHIYYTIPKECLQPGFWNIDELEELELITLHEPPSPAAKGILIFVEN